MKIRWNIARKVIQNLWFLLQTILGKDKKMNEKLWKIIRILIKLPDINTNISSTAKMMILRILHSIGIPWRSSGWHSTTFTAENTSSVSGQGTKILKTMKCQKKEKQNNKKNKKHPKYHHHKHKGRKYI